MSELLYRAFDPGPVEVAGDGRTVEARIVPYDTVAEVWDDHPIRECFDYGAFSAQSRAVASRSGHPDRPVRVEFRRTHEDRFDNVIGWSTVLEEHQDGLYGTFRLVEAGAAKVAELLRELYTGISVGFIPKQNRREGNVVHRVRAHLDHVAAVIEPAYADAAVLAVRADESAAQGRTGTPLLDEVLAWRKTLVDA